MGNLSYNLLCLFPIVFAAVHSAGSLVVSNVQVREMENSDGSWTASVTYDLFDNSTKSLWVWAFLSTDGGTSWQTFQSTGDTGFVAIGQDRNISFNFPYDGAPDCKVRVYASNDPVEYEMYKSSPEKSIPVPALATVDGKSTVAYLQTASPSYAVVGK